MAGYRDLSVWHRGIDLCIEIYELTKKLPREETYALSDQLRRAAVSIPSNIAEGQAREAGREFIHFLYIAQGSRAEIETQLDICVRLKYFSEAQVYKANSLCGEVGRMLTGLIGRQKALMNEKKN